MLPLFHVDAFTDAPFAGNPAAVCLLPQWHDDVWLQNVARDMNLSETAFLVPTGPGFHLRWFTPTVEVALCGHATLASAHVLWSEGLAPTTRPIAFATLSGTLTATKLLDLVELDFPLTPALACDAPPGLANALGVAPTYVARNQFDFLVEVSGEGVVRGLAPDFAKLARLPVRGVIVTSTSEDIRFDFVSRFFAPAAGVNEDPVTGSAHCCLAHHWHARTGKSAMTGYQASTRGGVVRVRVAGDRVFLGGQAVTVAKGALLV